MKRSRINPISKKRRQRSGKPGKLGIVRLYGAALTALRDLCYARDRGFCRLRLPGCKMVANWYDGEMAHVKAKRNNGDTLDNVQWACASCHAKSHNAGGKPCPPKEPFPVKASAVW